MAKAKKQSKAKLDLVDEDGYLCLTGNLFWRWRAHDAEMRAHSTSLQTLSTQIAAEIQKNELLAKMMSDKAAAASELSQAKRAYDEVMREIFEATGIESKDLIINDKTGRLFTVRTDGSVGDAVKAPKRQRKRRG